MCEFCILLADNRSWLDIGPDAERQQCDTRRASVCFHQRHSLRTSSSPLHRIHNVVFGVRVLRPQSKDRSSDTPQETFHVWRSVMDHRLVTVVHRFTAVCVRIYQSVLVRIVTVKPRYNAVSGRHLLRPRYKRGAL